ncbi:bud emergence protein 1 [Basidiobolus ranarum]|uniref:Bud emergence protein 1 n=1 Tax=Basidiobolus ranarum TaxID=34480 RepID=A0ABR2WTJ8_9FUNG
MRAPKLFRRSTYTLTKTTHIERTDSVRKETSIVHDSTEVKFPEPKKYVKALYNYQTPLDKDFTFQAGEVLYVIGQENDKDWWVVCNPITKKSGLVPVKFLKVIEDVNSMSEKKKARSAPASRSGSSSKRIEKTSLPNLSIDIRPTINTRKRGISNAQASLYGEVHSTFIATTPEQLSVAAGEVVVVVGCPMPKWILAKPIGKLVGPGLIPHSHVQIYDALTKEKVTDIVGHLPKPVSVKQQVIRGEVEKVELNQIVSASVYGYRLFGDTSEYDLDITLSGAPYSRQLIKTYEEFYEFHLGLLQLFPEFTGLNGLPRLIPYLPAPTTVNSVDATRVRATQLTAYLTELCELPREVKGSFFARSFFGETEPATRLSYDFNLDTSPNIRSLPTPSLTESNSSRSSALIAPEFAKVKVIYDADIIIIRVSTEIPLSDLKQKITARIGTFGTLGYYNDYNESQLSEICSDYDLKLAWSQTFQKDSTKLVLRAE